MMLGKNELLGWFFQMSSDGTTNGVAEMACQANCELHQLKQPYLYVDTCPRDVSLGMPPVDKNRLPLQVARCEYVVKRVDLLRRLAFVYYNS